MRELGRATGHLVAAVAALIVPTLERITTELDRALKEHPALAVLVVVSALLLIGAVSVVAVVQL